jgi:small-conductance mechanosensitive channel
MKFFKIGKSKSPMPGKLSKTDYYQIITSFLMVILGVIILIRSLSGPITPMTLLVGGGFLGLGVYRLNYVVKYFKGKQQCSHR